MLFLLGVNPDGRYQSEPGVGAGSLQGFSASVVFINAQVVGGNRTLVSNFDGTNGWRILQQMDTDTGTVTFTVELRRDDATTFSASYANRHGLAVAYFAQLDVGEGDDPDVTLWLNGNPVINTTLGVGTFFVPAANTPFELASADSTGAVFYGGGAFSSGVPFVGTQVISALYMKQNERYVPRFGLWKDSFGPSEEGFPVWDNAWDVTSLLNSALPGSSDLGGGDFIRNVSSPTWLPAPTAGEEPLTRIGDNFPSIVKLDHVDWAPVVPVEIVEPPPE